MSSNLLSIRKLSCLFLLLAVCTSSPYFAATPTEIPPFQAKKPIHKVLVLGGGGSKGFAHLGAIRELEAAGIRPDLIIGCSAGAIAGALYADKPEEAEIDKILLSMKRSDILDRSFHGKKPPFQNIR